MRKILRIIKKKQTFLLILFFGTFIGILSSAFKKEEVTKPGKIGWVCGGPFYTGNIQNSVWGTPFRISFPATGAPGEPNYYNWYWGSYSANSATCNRCHSSYPNNSGGAILTLDVGGGITQYIAGQTYTVTVTISNAPTNFLDFMITTRDEGTDSLPIGDFIITDNVGTQLNANNTWFGPTGSGYVQGTACSIDAPSPHYDQWTFNWKAPTSHIVGPLTFYLTAVSANFDNDISGDYTFSTTLQLQPPTGISNNSAQADLKLYPNPSTGKFTIQNNNDISLSGAEIKVYDITGKKIYSKTIDSPSQAELDLSNQSNGIYFLLIENSGELFTDKLIIQK